MSAVNTAGYWVCKYTYIKGSKVLGVFLFPPSVLSSNRQCMRRLKCFKRKQSVTERCDSTLRQWHLQMTDGERGYKHINIINPLAGEKRRWGGFVACLSISSSSFVPLSARQYLLSDRCWRDEPLLKNLCPPCATAQRRSQTTPRQLRGRFMARMRKQCGIWQRRWLPALCRTPPARSPLPEASCGRRYKDKTWEWEASSKQQPGKRQDTGHTYAMPSGSKPKSLFLTSSSLGVKSGIRWILIIRSPTTWQRAQKSETGRKTFPTPHMVRRVRSIDSCFLLYFHQLLWSTLCVVSMTIHGALEKSSPAEITFLCLSAVQLTSGLPVPVSDPNPELWPRSCPAPVARLPYTPTGDGGDSPLITWKDRSFRAKKIITKCFSWQDVDCSKRSILSSVGLSAAACAFVMLQS